MASGSAQAEGALIINAPASPVLKPRPCCNPQLLQVFETGTGQTQERPRNWPPKLPRGAFCAVGSR
eukprot:10031408-Alexandrium_andersonii.AAC.1